MSVIVLTSDNFEETINNGTVLVNFSATWCGPCQVLGPVIEELAKDYDGRVKVAKIDIDSEKALTRRFKVMSVPTVILFNNGAETKRLQGARPKEDYVAELGVN